MTHPWLATFFNDPDAGFADLISGYADITPFQRADIPDAAWMLFRTLPAQDPIRTALGGAISNWLDCKRAIPAPVHPNNRRAHIGEICDVFEIIVLLDVVEAAEWCFDNRARMMAWTGSLADSSERDAYAGLLRMQALTQPLLFASRDTAPLKPLWMSICEKSGSIIPRYYLEIGLLGLRRLKPAAGQSTVPWLAGLTSWAYAQNPTANEFRAEWHFLKAIHTLTPVVWYREVKNVLRFNPFKDAKITAFNWWKKDVKFTHFEDLESVRAFSKEPIWIREFERAESQLTQWGFSNARPQIEALVSKHVEFADATGVLEYLQPTFTQLGNALIDTRQSDAIAFAERLARESLNFSVDHSQAWSLWASSIEAAGNSKASEILRWERYRRLPYNVDARAELAEFLIADNRVEEAGSLLADTFDMGLKSHILNAVHVRIVAHTEGVAPALAALKIALDLYPRATTLSILHDQLVLGRVPHLISNHYMNNPLITLATVETSESVLKFSRYAHMRRLGGQLSHPATKDAAISEVQRILAEEPEFAYAQLLAARQGIWQSETSLLPDFAAHFEQALHEEDRAKLEDLAQKQPRFRALTLIARALFGDINAAHEVDIWLDAPIGGSATTKELHKRLVAERGIGGTVALFDSLAHVKKRAFIRELQLVNEAEAMDVLEFG